MLFQMWDKPAAASGVCLEDVGKSPVAQKCLPLPPVTWPQIPPSERYAPGLQLKTFSGTVEGWTLPPERNTYTLHLDSPSPLGRGSQPGLGLVGWLHGIGIPGTGGNREKGGR